MRRFNIWRQKIKGMETNRYWNIDAYLAEEELVTVKLRHEAKNLAYLDAQADPSSRDIEAGKELRLPLWLSLAFAKREHADISTPAYFRESYKRTMSADPTALNLRKKSPYIYEVGAILSLYIEDNELPHILGNVFGERYNKIMDFAAGGKTGEVPPFVAKLSVFERKLYDTRREWLQQFDAWKNRQTAKIEVHKEIVPPAKRWKSKP